MWYLFRCSHHTSTSVNTLPSSDGSEIVSLSFRWLHVACFNDWVGGRRGGTVPRVSRFYALNWARPLDCSTASAAAWEERWRWRRDSHCLSDLFVKPRWKQAYRVPWWLTLDRFDLQSASQARCYLICCAVKQGLVTSSPSKQVCTHALLCTYSLICLNTEWAHQRWLHVYSINCFDATDLLVRHTWTLWFRAAQNLCKSKRGKTYKGTVLGISFPRKNNIWEFQISLNHDHNRSLFFSFTEP